jgi:flavin reductase (DIM6/NTAB) family NADH-FMN oxidoreductase RutF
MKASDDRGLTRQVGTDEAGFRACFGSFGTGVAVATCHPDGADGPGIGITINSLSSVSLDPPLALFCLDDSSTTVAAFLRSGHFALNILSEGQDALSNRYAREHALDPAHALDPWQSGAPILRGALAVADCVLHDVHGGGDHRILVGQVGETGANPDARPLLYYRGGYGSIGTASS